MYVKKSSIFLSVLLLLCAGCGGNKSTRVGTPDDLAHARVAVLMGSTHDAYISENYPEARVLRLDSEPDLFVALDNDIADATVYDEATYLVSYSQDGNYKQVGNCFVEEFGVGFRYGDELRERFNRFLSGIRADGTYDSICHNWFDGDYRRAKMPEWGDKPAGKPIRVGCCGTMNGFSFISNGQPAGFDMEILSRFAHAENRPMEIQLINFGGLIAALSAGKVDLIASGMAITEERSKSVAFSDPYFQSGAAIIVPNKAASVTEGLPRYASLEEAGKARFAVITGNLHDHYVTDRLPGATPLRYDTYTDVIMSLDQGTADVACLEGVVYEVSQKKTGKYRIIGSLFEDPYGFGFNKKTPELRDRFNTFLASARADGTLDEMNGRWVANFETAHMPDLGPVPAGKPLRVGCSGATEVFDMVADGHNAGFDIELAERFGRYIGRPVEFLTINFGGLIAALSSGKVDMICSAITINEERARQIDFSEPYFTSHSIAIVLRDRYAGASRDGSDVGSARVGAMTGTTGEMYIREHYPTAAVQDFDDINDALLSLTTDKSDYVVTTYTTALTAARKDGRLAVLPGRFIKEPCEIAVRQGNAGLLKQINAALAAFKADGTLDAVIARWIRPDGSDYPAVEVPAADTGEPLRVGIAANREPVSFIRDGHYDGLDIELIRRIADRMGRKVEFVDMKFSGLIAALESGRIDVIAANMSATEERRKRVDFSEGYFVNADVLVALKEMPATPAKSTKSWFARVGESFYNNLIHEDRYMLVVKGLWQTLLITFFAAILGTVFGGLVCAMRMSRNRMLNNFAGGYISVIRGTPVLVLLMILFYVVFASSGLGATAVAILTFSLNMAAYSSEMFRTAIQGVDRGQKEAGIALGFTKTQTFIHIIAPQAVRTVMPVYKGELISMLKMTSVVGYIAVVDLTKASDIIRSRTFDAFFPLILVAVIYFLCAWLLGLGLDQLNRKISPRK